MGAAKEFKRAWKEMNFDQVSRHLEQGGCEFSFNPPSASHMGGVWERHIRTIRSVLNGMLIHWGGRLTSFTLRTFLCEVAAVINSRPLSVENLESAGCPRPLTPNHVLTMKSGEVLPPPGVFKEADAYVRHRWRLTQFLADEFWRRWRSEYLSSLQRRRKWQKPQRNLQVGDVVLVSEEGAFRGSWPMGRVVEAFPGKDGLVRSVKLLMAQGQSPSGKERFLVRPIHKVVVLVEAAAE